MEDQEAPSRRREVLDGTTLNRLAPKRRAHVGAQPQLKAEEGIPASNQSKAQGLVTLLLTEGGGLLAPPTPRRLSAAKAQPEALLPASPPLPPQLGIMFTVSTGCECHVCVCVCVAREAACGAGPGVREQERAHRCKQARAACALRGICASPPEYHLATSAVFDPSATASQHLQSLQPVPLCPSAPAYCHP